MIVLAKLWAARQWIGAGLILLLLAAGAVGVYKIRGVIAERDALALSLKNEEARTRELTAERDAVVEALESAHRQTAAIVAERGTLLEALSHVDTDTECRGGPIVHDTADWVWGDGPGGPVPLRPDAGQSVRPGGR